MADHEPEAAPEVEESVRFSAELSSHLETNYDIKVSGISDLDINVFHIEKLPAPGWVARVFGSESMQAERLAKVLSFLRQASFPAEKCAHKKPVTVFRGQKVLVTRYLGASRPNICDETFRRLGDILGKLHALPVGKDPTISWKGGAWHHICAHGGPHEEIAASATLLSESRARIPLEEHSALEVLRRELERINDFSNLPESLIHPDFVPNNIIEIQDGTLIPIDWAGSGQGPRVFSLSWLLFAAANSGIGMTKAVIDGYKSHIMMADDEISYIANSILTRQLSIACREICHREKKVSAIVESLPMMRRFAEDIVVQAAAAFNGDESKLLTIEPPESKATPQVQLQEVGTTSLFTAAVRAEESHRQNRLFDDPLAQAVILHFKYNLPKPGISERADSLRKFIVARTIFYDDLILSAIRNGCRQIVLLGAGMDTRAFRLPLPMETSFFELDTTDVLNSKNNILIELSASPICKRTVVPCDLRTDWPSLLLSAGFHPVEPTVWIIEGVFVYLDEEIVNKIVEAITAISPAGSRMGFDMASHDQSASTPWRLRRSAAPFDSIGWLAEYGWEAMVSSSRDVLRGRGRVTRELDSGKKVPKPKALLVDAVRKL